MQPTRDSEILFGAGRENADPKVHQLRPAPAGPHWADEKRAVQQQQTDAIVEGRAARVGLETYQN